MAEAFTFGIPLIARASASNWRLVEALLGLTLTSVMAQSDRGFRIVIAGHDRPRLPPSDARIVFLEADWPAEPVRSDNLDSGRKKYAIERFVLESGGGLLMFLDADDWVDTRLVATARALIGPGDIGGLIDRGFATDFWNLRAMPIPHTGVFTGEFHRICGSSTIARLKPDDPDLVRRDPYQVLHEHYRWIEVARDHGAEPVRLPICGNYVINTSENHSETYGPYACWRRRFAESVLRHGREVDEQFLARFGLGLQDVRSASSRLALEQPVAGRR